METIPDDLVTPIFELDLNQSRLNFENFQVRKHTNNSNDNTRRKIKKNGVIAIWPIEEVQKYVEDGIEVQSGKKKKPETTAVWACIACTFNNQHSAIKCEVCDTPKPYIEPSKEVPEFTKMKSVTTIVIVSMRRIIFTDKL